MSTHTITPCTTAMKRLRLPFSKIEAMGVSHADISIVGNNEGDRNASHLVGGHTAAETAIQPSVLRMAPEPARA